MTRDLRRYAQETHLRLLLGGLILLFFVGDGLIYLIYGQGPALMGFICLLAGLAPLVLILSAFWVIDWIIKKER